jgi:hypothetical protein
MILNIKQRFFVVGLYILIIISIGFYFNNNLQFIFNPSDKTNIIFIVTALTLLLSSYILEPYFTKPVDVVARWIAVFLFLNGLKEKDKFLLYNYWQIISILFISLALISIFVHGFTKFEKQQKALVSTICKLSRPEFVFSILYFDLVISFFRNEATEFPILIGFGFLLVINKPIHYFTIGVWNLFNYLSSNKPQPQYIGKIIGHESEDFYTVEVIQDPGNISGSLIGQLIELGNNKICYVGIIINEKFLLGKKWAQVQILRDDRKHIFTYNANSQELLDDVKSVYSKENSIKILQIANLPSDVKAALEQNTIVKNSNNIVGYIWSGSTINKIKFYSMISEDLIKDKGIGEGSIIQSKIADQEVLFQIIDARTDEENLEFKDSHGFTVATAQKLGKYDFSKNELETVKWLPKIYEPVFLLKPESTIYDPKLYIGRLPNTNYGIPIKNISALVTHNTAILGILGIGKSCLTFELIQKIISNTSVKIFCIDITNQYSKELTKYIQPEFIQDEISVTTRDELRKNNPNGTEKNQESWGNEKLYKEKLNAEFKSFIESEKRILLLNPDLHTVSKAGSSFNIQHKTDLTVAEKTRIISERLFVKAKEKGETTDARFQIIFEEAHSLVPEWNSVSNDGDKSATNGTAKVILQGRKYGLGSMVITQRTANISKSILNQCNTIFALRVFDDTGKQFLENYIGSDYSNLLPTLEERHAVVIGKALKLKQPVIIELNDRELLIGKEVQT